MKQLEQALENYEADYHEIDAKLKESGDFISVIQNEREETLQKTRLLELEQSQRHVKRENLANHLQESYHTPLAGA